jgi:hypothetical protein
VIDIIGASELVGLSPHGSCLHPALVEPADPPPPLHPVVLLAFATVGTVAIPDPGGALGASAQTITTGSICGSSVRIATYQ